MLETRKSISPCSGMQGIIPRKFPQAVRDAAAAQTEHPHSRTDVIWKNTSPERRDQAPFASARKPDAIRLEPRRHPVSEGGPGDARPGGRARGAAGGQLDVDLDWAARHAVGNPQPGARGGTRSSRGGPGRAGLVFSHKDAQEGTGNFAGSGHGIRTDVPPCSALLREVDIAH